MKFSYVVRQAVSQAKAQIAKGQSGERYLKKHKKEDLDQDRMLCVWIEW
ncbi:MAG: hypothetical protein HFI39_02045 [Lachnospiraceae bacterium]|nr:hypothetical protein [Lachnospiraceae bacterium]